MSFKELPIPQRVRAALDTLEHFRCIEDSCEVHRRPLTKAEESVRGSALRVLHLYLSGEMDYGDSPPSLTTGKQDPDETGSSVVF
jgi:hypothetical protein